MLNHELLRRWHDEPPLAFDFSKPAFAYTVSGTIGDKTTVQGCSTWVEAQKAEARFESEGMTVEVRGNL
jgi:hypothetical protein